jgi:hypothetical protein
VIFQVTPRSPKGSKNGEEKFSFRSELTRNFIGNEDVSLDWDSCLATEKEKPISDRFFFRGVSETLKPGVQEIRIEATIIVVTKHMTSRFMHPSCAAVPRTQFARNARFRSSVFIVVITSPTSDEIGR